MVESAKGRLSMFFLSVFVALAILASPSLAQSDNDFIGNSAINDSSGNTTASGSEPLRPRGLLLAPPVITLPSTGAPLPSPGDPAPAPRPQGPAGLANRVASRDRLGPRREDLTAIRVADHVNAIFDGFQQGAGLGFGIEFTTGESIPGLELRAMALTSTKLYRRFEVSAYVPKVGSENTHVEVWFNYLRRTKDTFFGIGSRTNESDETNFDLEMREVAFNFTHDISDQARAGFYVGRYNAASYRGRDDNDPPIDVLFSGDPSTVPVERWIPGLLQGTEVFQYGAFFELDARDNSVGLTKGGYFYGRVGSADGLNDDAFSDFGWTEAILDGRGYVPLGSDRTSFAIRGLADLRSPKRGSQIPFFANATLGGRNLVRGYRNFRFRAHNLLMFSGELRQTFYTRDEDQGADVVFFGDVGRIWGDTRSDTDPQILRNDLFGEAPWRAGYGIALQFRYNKSFAVRIDFSRSPERSMIYFSLSRGF